MNACRIGGEGIAVEILPRGATIVAIEASDRNGKRANVVAHYDSLQTYLNPPERKTYYGATVGRYANRIAQASFSLAGRSYAITANQGAHALHGGLCGFDALDWEIAQKDDVSVTFALTSAHLDQGFPGELRCTVRFTVSNASLTIAYEAVTDADTVVNLTNHSYFDLSAGGAPAREQVLQIFADAYTPVDDDSIPDGRIVAVAGTRYDFREPKRIGNVAFDANWVLRGSGLKRAARLEDPVSGRILDVRTTEPGLQMYSANAAGIALETQHFPDSPNHAHFPTTVVRRGERYASTTVYEFLT